MILIFSKSTKISVNEIYQPYLIQRSCIGYCHCEFCWTNECQLQAVFTNTQNMWSKFSTHHDSVSKHANQLESLITCIIQCKSTLKMRPKRNLLHFLALLFVVCSKSQLRCINIQAQTVDFSTKVWGVCVVHSPPRNLIVIHMYLCIVLGSILKTSQLDYCNSQSSLNMIYRETKSSFSRLCFLCCKYNC